MSAAGSPPVKRRKAAHAEHPLCSLDRGVSPPPLSRQASSPSAPRRRDPAADDALADLFRARARSFKRKEREERDAEVGAAITRPIELVDDGDAAGAAVEDAAVETVDRTADDAEAQPAFRSPFALTRIRGLPDAENVDAVRIGDVLGDVMLREAWVFNYCIDVRWVMAQLDADVRDAVRVYFVHGIWRREEKERFDATARPYPNVKSIAAFMPEPFGTHHSKILVLFRRDDTARVIIHTANMVQFDWTNMTQAAWISPILPLERHGPAAAAAPRSVIGQTFKDDFLAYVRFYATRTAALVEQLEKYSFAAVRAVFVGSVPGRHSAADAKWAWPALRRVLSTVPVAAVEKQKEDQKEEKEKEKEKEKEGLNPRIVVQVSSIATLGVKDTWLSPVLFKALSATRGEAGGAGAAPEFAIIFPTADEIRDSLDGYRAGTSLHAKTTSAAQKKQMSYLRPLLHRWSSSPEPTSSTSSTTTSAPRFRDAGRARAMPHVKTFMRFSAGAAALDRLDWALLTSANLSTQAWGGAATNAGEVRVCSYEAGVLVHPALFGEDVVMRPVFRRDTYTPPPGEKEGDGDASEGKVGRKAEKTLPLRMPYALPLTAYAPQDEIWDQTRQYPQPDGLGQQWIFTTD